MTSTIKSLENIAQKMYEARLNVFFLRPAISSSVMVCHNRYVHNESIERRYQILNNVTARECECLQHMRSRHAYNQDERISFCGRRTNLP